MTGPDGVYRLGALRAFLWVHGLGCTASGLVLLFSPASLESFLGGHAVYPWLARLAGTLLLFMAVVAVLAAIDRRRDRLVSTIGNMGAWSAALGVSSLVSVKELQAGGAGPVPRLLFAVFAVCATELVVWSIFLLLFSRVKSVKWATGVRDGRRY